MIDKWDKFIMTLLMLGAVIFASSVFLGVYMINSNERLRIENRCIQELEG